MAGIAAADLHLVTWGIERSEGFRRGDLHLDRYAVERRGGELFGVEGIEIFNQTVVAGQKLGIAQADAFLAARRDGKNAQAIESPAGVLEQRRVALFADDLFIEAARLGGVEQFGLGGAAVDIHGKPVELAAARDREEIGALELERVGIIENLIDLGHGHLVFDPHRDVVIAHFKRGHGRREMGRKRRARRPGDDDHAVGEEGGRTAEGQCEEEYCNKSPHLRLLS